MFWEGRTARAQVNLRGEYIWRTTDGSDWLEGEEEKQQWKGQQGADIALEGWEGFRTGYGQQDPAGCQEIP